MISAPRLSTAGKVKGFPEECSTTVGMGNGTVTSTHSLGVAVRTFRAGWEKLSHQNARLRSSDAPHCPLHDSNSSLSILLQCWGVLPQGSALCCPPCHLSGEQSPGSGLPGPREPSSSLVGRDSACCSWLCRLGGIKDTHLISSFPLHPHIGIPIVVDRTTKYGHPRVPLGPPALLRLVATGSNGASSKESPHPSF